MGKHHGLNPRCYPAPLREFVGIDYEHKLNEAEKAWLSKFSDEFERGCFEENPLHRSGKQRREIWRDVKARKQDAIGIARTLGELECVDDGEHPANASDWRKPVEDLVHAAAVESLRAVLPPIPRDPRRLVRMTKAHRAAVARLIDINHRQTAGL